MKLKYINWSTEIFQGFYESDLYNADTIYNINANRDDDEPEYDFVDSGYEKYCDDVSKQITEQIFYDLDQKEDGEIIKSMTFVKLHSPKYYNFETDKIEAEIEVDWQALIDWVKDNTYLFSEYLKNNFSSYDGFISFVPNNTNDFWDALDGDFERLSDVLIEFYILQHLDQDIYREHCYEIATNTIWQYLEPVKADDESNK